MVEDAYADSQLNGRLAHVFLYMLATLFIHSFLGLCMCVYRTIGYSEDRVLVYQQNNNISRFGCFASEFFQIPVSHLSSFVSNHVLERMFSGFLAAWSSSSEMEIAVSYVSLLGSRITSESNWFTLHSMINVLHLENPFFDKTKLAYVEAGMIG